MKTNYQVTLCSLIFIFWVNQTFSQSPHIYDLPVTAHSLKLKKKGDISFSLGTMKWKDDSNFAGLTNSGFGTQVYNYDFQVTPSNFQLGYNILNRLSISLSHDRIKTKTIYNAPFVSLHFSHLTGIGLGTYKSIILGREKISNEEKTIGSSGKEILIDFHLGYQRGKIKNQYLVYELGEVSINFQKYYLQGGVHFMLKHIDFSYMLKFGKINYLNGMVQGKPDSSDNQTIISVTEVSNFVIWENTFKAEVKLNRFGVFAQTTLSSNQEFSRSQWVSMVVHFGVAVRFNEKELKGK